MSTLAEAWDAFMRAIDEARALANSGAEPLVTAEHVRHARDLLDIIEAKIAAHQIDISAGAAIAVLAQLRSRLESLEKDVMPTRH